MYLLKRRMVCQFDESGGLDGKVFCILAYDGSTKDIILNYTLLTLNIAVAWQSVCGNRGNVIGSGDIYGTTHSSAPVEGLRLRAFLSLLFVIMFQIILCLLVGCTGISIIWCAIGGWILMDHFGCFSPRNARNRSTPSSGTELGSHASTSILQVHQATMLAIDLIAILYYAIVAESITTLAHL